MSFNSLQFFFFLPTVTIVHFIIPQRFRWLWLLAASYYFYMSWQPQYALLMLASTVIAYATALKMDALKMDALKIQTHKIEAPAAQKQRKLFFWSGVGANLAILFLFKYFNFFNENAAAIFQQIGVHYPIPRVNLLLPVGISFYTFHNLNYLIDLYYHRIPAERHFGRFALYVAFFPLLAAGPIERSTNLLPQFYEKKEFDAQKITSGLYLILWGFFKKIVIADRLAIYVNTVYNTPQAFHGLPIILATYFFAFQIYCDFSAYSDIARGAARCMGYELMINFRQPYFSTSIIEFWRRWHISLSTWFRDYLYFPLGGSRVARWRWQLNLLIVFVVSGLWHGANWTFVIWGAIHGLFSVITNQLTYLQSRLAVSSPKISLFFQSNFVRGLQICLTFHLVLFTWLFFRANSLTDVMTLLTNAAIVSPSTWSGSNLAAAVLVNPNQFVIGICAIIVLLAVELLQTRRSLAQLFAVQPTWLRWSAYYMLVMVILAFGEFRSQDFIYFQF